MPSPLSPRQLARRLMTAGLPRRLFMVSGPRSSGAICLTFDDGPHPVHTPVLLDKLREHRLTATFFLVGDRIEQHPEIVQRIAREGHEVGHHSFHHTEPSTTSALTLMQEARRTSQLIGKLTGRRPRLFRPPHGKLTPGKSLTLWLARQTIVLWNRDPKDFANTSAEPLRAWFAREALGAGDILLLHDNHPHAAAALDTLADRLRAARLTTTTPAAWA